MHVFSFTADRCDWNFRNWTIFPVFSLVVTIFFATMLRILVLICMLFNFANGDAFFYIYEWPTDLGDVYPPPGAKLDKESKYDHTFYENRGAGQMLVPDVGLFQTWQFSLYKNAMSRLAVSKYRTR